MEEEPVGLGIVLWWKSLHPEQKQWVVLQLESQRDYYAPFTAVTWSSFRNGGVIIRTSVSNDYRIYLNFASGTGNSKCYLNNINNLVIYNSI